MTILDFIAHPCENPRFSKSPILEIREIRGEVSFRLLCFLLDPCRDTKVCTNPKCDKDARLAFAIEKYRRGDAIKSVIAGLRQVHGPVVAEKYYQKSSTKAYSVYVCSGHFVHDVLQWSCGASPKLLLKQKHGNRLALRSLRSTLKGEPIIEPGYAEHVSLLGCGLRRDRAT